MTLECPKCKSPVAREGQKFCYRCGQELSDYYKSINIEIKDSGALGDAQRADAPLADQPQPATPAGPVAGAEIARTMVLGSASSDIQTAEVSPAPAPKQQARLVIVLPTGDVFDREIGQTETQMGKGPRNDIVIADPAVSTAHARIQGNGSTYTITDLGSRNGTFVNSERLTVAARELHHGDIIGIGLSKLTFRLTDHSETGSIVAETTAAIQRPVVPPLTEDSLANALLAAGLVARENLERVRGAEALGRRLSSALVEEQLISEADLRDVMSRTFQIPLIDLRSEPPDAAIATKLSPQLARDHQIIPVRQEGDSLLLALADPTDTAAVEEARRTMQLAITLRLATASEILEQVDRSFGPRLIGVLPSGAKFEYFVNQTEVEIGKAAHNHIVLQDPTVSNTHAILMARSGGYTIVDLGSRNGTYINGERLGTQAHTMRHGDTIQLGQTVLTFRNRAETTANVTATLSPDALAEIRERTASFDTSADQALPAGSSTSPPPAVALPINTNPALVSSAGAASEVEDKKDDKGDKKKKKKKKKGGQDERLRAAYIGAVGRILAAIFSVVLTVGITLYLTRSGGEVGKAKFESSKKGKPKIKIKDVGGTPFNFNGELVEASGVVTVPDKEAVLFVDDKRTDAVLWMQINEQGQQQGDIKAIPLGVTVADPEGITYGNSFFYVMGSQSKAKASEGNVLVRFRLDSSGQAVQGKADAMPGLRDFLVTRVPELKDQNDDGSLNIEGITWDPARERLLLGLRSPVVDNQALIVPLKLRDPLGPFTTDNLDLGATIRLTLDGNGIRDIQYDLRSNSFFIISGAAQHHEKKEVEFALWTWNGDSDQSNDAAKPHKMDITLNQKMKPEGITRMKIGARDFLFIVGDSGSYTILDYAEEPA